MCVCHVVYPFICQWILELLSSFGCCVQTCIQVSAFNYFGFIPSSRIARSYVTCMFNVFKQLSYYFPQQLHDFIVIQAVYKHFSFYTSSPTCPTIILRKKWNSVYKNTLYRMHTLHYCCSSRKWTVSCIFLVLSIEENELYCKMWNLYYWWRELFSWNSLIL